MAPCQAPVQPQAEDDRKLKSFGFVHGHYPYKLISFSQCDRGLHLAGGRLFSKMDEKIP